MINFDQSVQRYSVTTQKSIMWYILHWNIITDNLLCVKFHMSILFNNILGTENTKCHIIQNGFKKRQHLYTEILDFVLSGKCVYNNNNNNNNN